MLEEINVFYKPDPYDNGDGFSFGLDAEILPLKNKIPIYPHQSGLGQHRGEKAWANTYMDWHGDGFAFELCVKPSHCIELICNYVASGLRFLSEKLNIERYEAPTIYTIPKQLFEDSPPQVKQLGCMPSFNVYSDRAKPKTLENDRTTGCHLHVSLPDKEFKDNTLVQCAIKWADVLCGNTWVLVSSLDNDLEKRRRLAYGRAGEHRRTMYGDDTKYGFEYRVLPGQVLSHPVYLSMMLGLVRQAANLAITTKKDPPSKWIDQARIAINNNDKDQALKLFELIPFNDQFRVLVSWYRTRRLPSLSLNEWWRLSDYNLLYRGWYSLMRSHEVSCVCVYCASEEIRKIKFKEEKENQPTMKENKSCAE